MSKTYKQRKQDAKAAELIRARKRHLANARRWWTKYTTAQTPETRRACADNLLRAVQLGNLRMVEVVT